MAVVAPVSMLVVPGPIEEVHAIVASLRFARANPDAAWTIDCSFAGWWNGRSAPYSTRAWLSPDTLPCPRIPHTPWMNRCSTPSRSLYWD